MPAERAHHEPEPTRIAMTEHSAPDGSVRVTRLDNGLTIATDHIPHVETVALGAFVGVGTRHEAAEMNGVAHLLEHMAFKGTDTRSARDIAEEIEAVGGLLNAYTGRESTAYYAKVLKEHAPLALDIISDILLNPRFDEEELQRERQVILQELGQAHDTPDDIIFDHFQETAFPDQGVGRPVLGRSEIIAGLGPEDLRAYMQRFYGAETMVISAAGKIDHDQFVEMASKAFAPLGKVRPDAAEPARYVGGDYRETRDLEQVHVILGLPGVGYRDPDYYAAAVLATLLGGGMSSRLFQKVREERGLVYTVFCFHNAASDSGLFGVYAGTGEKEVAELMPVVCEEIADVAKNVSADELARARQQLKASILMGRESTSGRCEQLASHLLIYDRPLSTQEIVEGVESVGVDQVQALARRLAESRPTLTSLGPVERVEPFDRIAGRFAA
jgi:predicted Zn-dependent peptidase